MWRWRLTSSKPRQRKESTASYRLRVMKLTESPQGPQLTLVFGPFKTSYTAVGLGQFVDITTGFAYIR